MIIKIPHRDDAESTGVNPDSVHQIVPASDTGSVIRLVGGREVQTGLTVDEAIAALNTPDGTPAQAIEWLGNCIDGLANAIQNHS